VRFHRRILLVPFVLSCRDQLLYVDLYFLIIFPHQCLFSPSTNIDREECCNQNYMADSQEDYPDSGDINITNTGVEKLLKNLNPRAYGVVGCETLSKAFEKSRISRSVLLCVLLLCSRCMWVILVYNLLEHTFVLFWRQVWWQQISNHQELVWKNY
jgi:hypothetical protein